MYHFKNQQSDMGNNQKITLPLYTLDSNLILLPGIVYNVTFPRLKAAALLYRFKDQTSGIALIKNLLAEYEFDNKNAPKDSNTDELTRKISKEAETGIREYYSMEQKSKNQQFLGYETASGFDLLLLAIVPNLDKISVASGRNKNDYKDVVTIVRIMGIADDSNNVRITLQALNRGKIASETSKGYEGKIDVNWNFAIRDRDVLSKKLYARFSQLFQRVDEFLKDYRTSLNNSSDKNKEKEQSKDGDLLILNPLANALFLHLAGSKDYASAYSNLQKLYKTLASNFKIESKTILRFVDLSCAIVPFPAQQKLDILNISDPSERIKAFIGMIGGLSDVFDNLKENNLFVNNWFNNEATYLQKANVVANQLRSIRLLLDSLSNSKSNKPGATNKPLRSQNLIRSRGKAGNNDNYNDGDGNGNNEDDDLNVIHDFIKNRLPHISSISDDSKRLIVKDYKRIRNSPPGNSDFHVIRNYLETVADLPWDRYISKFSSSKDIDLAMAKKQLDDDHYGLEYVKRRLVQYLVVLKLLDMNADKNFEQDENTKARKSELSNKTKNINELQKKESSDDSSIIIAHEGDDNSSNARKINDTKEYMEKSAAKQKSVMVSKHNKSPLILLAGPPGTGKTSLAKSIASALGRSFQRVSLGGVKDESEIRGHRRTYVGAMPGVIVQALRKSRSMNPVILLDEIDKVVGGNMSYSKVNGDPAAALLEVLDPEQNDTFTDHYLGFPIDLSQVIFICTANEPSNLSKPLWDRLEMIEVSAYDHEEKVEIGTRYLLPRQIKRNGLPRLDLVKIDKPVMKKIILDYTREAGVRSFERRLATICRFKAVEYSESMDGSREYETNVKVTDLPKYLGVPYPSLSSEIYDSPLETSKFGVVNGLSYNSDGSGSVLVFESIGFPTENKNGPKLSMTGRLGEVLMESAKIGLTFVRLIVYKDLLNLIPMRIQENLVEKLRSFEINLHVPLGSIQKDGPSAGITMTLLFLSLLLEKPVPSDLAMTGEITLRGLVLPIGGVREKVLGAHLAGMKRVIIPRENRKDVIQEYCRATNDYSQMNALLEDNADSKFTNWAPEAFWKAKFGIELLYAKEFWDVIKHVWGDGLLVKVEQARMLDYHL